MSTITLEVPGAGGRTVTGDEQHVRAYVESVQRQLVQRTQWPRDPEDQMTALGRLFPSMVRFDGSTVPGIDPWDGDALVKWLNTSGEPTSGSRHAALFLLSVWNSDDWVIHGLKVRKIEKGGWKGARRIGRLDLKDAWAAWDQEHRAAALAWLVNPFMP